MKILIVGTLTAILASTTALAVGVVGQPPRMHNPYIPYTNSFAYPNSDPYGTNNPTYTANNPYSAVIQPYSTNSRSYTLGKNQM